VGVSLHFVGVVGYLKHVCVISSHKVREFGSFQEFHAHGLFNFILLFAPILLGLVSSFQEISRPAYYINSLQFLVHTRYSENTFRAVGRKRISELANDIGCTANFLLVIIFVCCAEEVGDIVGYVFARNWKCVFVVVRGRYMVGMAYKNSMNRNANH
jgi:hypothetical protein